MDRRIDVPCKLGSVREAWGLGSEASPEIPCSPACGIQAPSLLPSSIPHVLLTAHFGGSVSQILSLETHKAIAAPSVPAELDWVLQCSAPRCPTQGP